MSVSAAEFHSVLSHLKSLYIQVSNDWVSDRVCHCKSSIPNITFTQLKNVIYQEWLTSNLRDLKAHSFPPNILSHSSIVLNDMYIVQVESMFDSSKSFYSELQRVRQMPTSNVEVTEKSGHDNTKANRCLTFLLCDGVQEVQAMEYQSISSIRLSSDFLPGFKILIKGPVVCRKGMLLLKEENVKVYGGKVQTLCETNNIESLLLRKLGLSENAFDQDKSETISAQCKLFDEVNDHPETSKCQSSSITNNFPINSSSRSVEMDEWFSESDDVLLNVSLQECSEIQCNKNFEANTFSDEECLRKSKKPKIESFDEQMQISQTNDESHFLHSDSVLNSVTTSTSEIDFDDMYDEIDNENSDDYYNKQSDISFKPKTVSQHPFIYLRQLSEMSPSKPGNYIVKAIILTLKSKIRVKNDEFSLIASICDGSFTSEVNFSSCVLENILGYSPSEITKMMAEKSKNLAINERIKKIFFLAQQKLLSMNCLMEVALFQDTSIPCVVAIDEIEVRHLNALQSRISLS